MMDPDGAPIIRAVRTDLDCPFSQKGDAKALGARWDPTNKMWYVPADKDLRPFRRWLPDNWCNHGASCDESSARGVRPKLSARDVNGATDVAVPTSAGDAPAAAGKKPKRTLDDVPRDLAYWALMKIQRTWNTVFYSSGERRNVLRLMKQVIRVGESSYDNPFGADDTEMFLDEFAELSASRRHCLFTICLQSVKTRASLGNNDLVKVLSA
tara:strand:- start:2733 stop:3365 length:633 start_codon:yes stop_codon:yes gene_type:complete